MGPKRNGDDIIEWHGGVRARRAVGIGVVAVVVFATLIAVGGGLEKTPRDQIGLSYGGGPIEGAHFQRAVQPGSATFFNGIGDHFYMYPVTQRNYIISKRPDEGDVRGSDFILAPSRDSIPVDFEVATYFKTNLSLLRKFHEQIGLKYAAWTDSGWDRMLHESFRQQIESAIQQEARRYDAVPIYSSQGVLLSIQREVGSVLKERVTSVLGDDYFCGPTYSGARPKVCPDFTFVIKKVDVPQGIKDALQQNRASEITIRTRQNEVLQAQQQARAIDVLQKALARSANSYLYVLLKAIESGKIDFWVLPSDGKLTLQAPQRQ